MRIVEELVEIWPDEVCDKIIDIILYSPKGKSNLAVLFPFPLGGTGSGISSIDTLFTLMASGEDSGSSLSSSNNFISHTLNG